MAGSIKNLYSISSRRFGKMAKDEMPVWAAESDWCLKAWVPFYVPDAKYSLCLLEKGHEGDCRTYTNGWTNRRNSLYLGDQSNG